MKVVFLMIAPLLSAWALAAPALPPGVVPPPFFERQGVAVLTYEKGPSGLHVWKVERNGVKTVFYTTADQKTLISGIMWDAKTGTNLSDAFITPDMTSAPSPGAAPEGAQFAPGKIPEAIKGIEMLAGVREGKAGPGKTLYIMFDPRCPHCKAVYRKTRDFVASGGTIKWIPVTTLGRPEEGARLVADILQASSPVKALAQAGKAGGTAPSPQTLAAITQNEAYFWAAFDRNKAAGQAGVPVAFFVTKQGVPQMVGAIDDDILLGQILAELKP